LAGLLTVVVAGLPTEPRSRARRSPRPSKPAAFPPGRPDV